ncbi:MAG: CBS domain-containing protein, partial [Planctomycetota bacterium]
VASLGPGATVLEAARLMNERGIGSVMVIDKDRLAGIFTERDVLRRVVAEQRDPAKTKLADVMTSPVACAAPQTTLDEIRQVMRGRRIRHVPVVNRKRVLGMISIGDLNKAEREVQVETIRYLEQYISVS